MKTYQYQILRYVHDQFTGEFVNLGVVVYAPQEQFLKAVVSQKYGRVTNLFPNVNGRFLNQLVRNFEISVHRVAKELNQLFRPSENLSNITKLILPQDDSALVLTEVRLAVDVDLEAATNDLYHHLVDKYYRIADEHSLTDEDVWRKKYKAYFDKYGVSSRLVPHQIITQNDSFEFDRAWKNEIWHCLEPVSFDFQSSDDIKKKVYRWSGILKEMNSVKEKMHLVLLTSLSNEHQEMSDFIVRSLEQESEFLYIDVVAESGAERLARLMKQQMQAHDEDL